MTYVAAAAQVSSLERPALRSACCVMQSRHTVALHLPEHRSGGAARASESSAWRRAWRCVSSVSE